MQKYFIISLIALLLSGLGMYIWASEVSLDVKFYYTHQEALTFFKELTPSQVQGYLKNEIVDLFYILSYSNFLFLLGRRFFRSKRSLVFTLVPGFLDLWETIPIILILQNQMFPPPWLGPITCLKWISVGLVLLALATRLRRRSLAQ